MPFVAIALCVAAAPVAALAVMAVAGLATPFAAAVAICVTILSATAFVLIWARDLDLLAEALHEMEADNVGTGPASEAVGLIPDGATGP